MINQKDLEEILLQNKILDDKQLKKYSERTRKSTETLEDVIVEEKIISPESANPMNRGQNPIGFRCDRGGVLSTP